MNLPVPVSTAETAEYWRAAARGELLFQRCAACGTAQFPPRLACAACQACDLAWERSSGRGEVHACTVVHRAPTPAFRAAAPYIVALVDLREGFRMMANLRDCPAERAVIGLPVRIVFEARGDLALPQAVPLGDDDAVR